MTNSAQSFLGMSAVLCSRPIRDLFARIERIAKSDFAVLIHGESGSGKELAARAVHHYSNRAKKAWVDLNCAALPEQLIESELFGYERGAFSGAETTKPGLFELASGGTLFLDEIADLDLRLQTKLLRVLDGVPFFRLGGTKKVETDVRIVAASNRNLRELVQTGKFREDLYHRLAQVCVTVPPLRERIDDIVPLAELFLNKYAKGRSFTADASRALEAYSWPGNIRELRNLVVQCILLAPDEAIGRLDLPETVQDAYARLPQEESDLKRLHDAVQSGITGDGLAEEALPSAPSRNASQGAMLEDVERRLILEVLQQTGGHQEKAAHLLGISRRTLGRKLRHYEQT
jgi:transcriptional regulator with PAS, ATPase and Fis domain